MAFSLYETFIEATPSLNTKYVKNKSPITKISLVEYKDKLNPHQEYIKNINDETPIIIGKHKNSLFTLVTERNKNGPIIKTINTKIEKIPHEVSESEREQSMFDPSLHPEPISSPSDYSSEEKNKNSSSYKGKLKNKEATFLSSRQNITHTKFSLSYNFYSVSEQPALSVEDIVLCELDYQTRALQSPEPSSALQSYITQLYWTNRDYVSLLFSNSQSGKKKSSNSTQSAKKSSEPTPEEREFVESLLEAISLYVQFKQEEKEYIRKKVDSLKKVWGNYTFLENNLWFDSHENGLEEPSVYESEEPSKKESGFRIGSNMEPFVFFESIVEDLLCPLNEKEDPEGVRNGKKTESYSKKTRDSVNNFFWQYIVNNNSLNTIEAVKRLKEKIREPRRIILLGYKQKRLLPCSGEEEPKAKESSLEQGTFIGPSADSQWKPPCIMDICSEPHLNFSFPDYQLNFAMGRKERSTSVTSSSVLNLLVPDALTTKVFYQPSIPCSTKTWGTSNNNERPGISSQRNKYVFKNEKDEDTIFYNLLVDENGEESYIISLVYYEEINVNDKLSKNPQDKLCNSLKEIVHGCHHVNGTEELDSDMTEKLNQEIEYFVALVPTVISFVTKIPDFKFFCSLLRRVKCENINRGKVLLDSVFLGFEQKSSTSIVLPFPSIQAGNPSLANLETKQQRLTLSFNPEIGLPLCNLQEMYHLFVHIGLADILIILGLLVFEHGVVIVSRDKELLPVLVESLRQLIYPFEWHYPVFFYLNKGMASFLEAPTPLLVGAERGILQRVEYGEVDRICFDVDTSEFFNLKRKFNNKKNLKGFLENNNKKESEESFLSERRTQDSESDLSYSSSILSKSNSTTTEKTYNTVTKNSSRKYDQAPFKLNENKASGEKVEHISILFSNINPRRKSSFFLSPLIDQETQKKLNAAFSLFSPFFTTLKEDLRFGGIYIDDCKGTLEEIVGFNLEGCRMAFVRMFVNLLGVSYVDYLLFPDNEENKKELSSGSRVSSFSEYGYEDGDYSIYADSYTIGGNNFPTNEHRDKEKSKTRRGTQRTLKDFLEIEDFISYRNKEIKKMIKKYTEKTFYFHKALKDRILSIGKKKKLTEVIYKSWKTSFRAFVGLDGFYRFINQCSVVTGSPIYFFLDGNSTSFFKMCCKEEDREERLCLKRAALRRVPYTEFSVGEFPMVLAKLVGFAGAQQEGDNKAEVEKEGIISKLNGENALSDSELNTLLVRLLFLLNEKEKRVLFYYYTVASNRRISFLTFSSEHRNSLRISEQIRKSFVNFRLSSVSSQSQRPDYSAPNQLFSSIQEILKKEKKNSNKSYVLGVLLALDRVSLKTFESLSQEEFVGVRNKRNEEIFEILEVYTSGKRHSDSKGKDNTICIKEADKGPLDGDSEAPHSLTISKALMTFLSLERVKLAYTILSEYIQSFIFIKEPKSKAQMKHMLEVEHLMNLVNAKKEKDSSLEDRGASKVTIGKVEQNSLGNRILFIESVLGNLFDKKDFQRIESFFSFKNTFFLSVLTSYVLLLCSAPSLEYLQNNGKSFAKVIDTLLKSLKHFSVRISPSLILLFLETCTALKNSGEASRMFSLASNLQIRLPSFVYKRSVASSLLAPHAPVEMSNIPETPSSTKERMVRVSKSLPCSNLKCGAKLSLYTLLFQLTSSPSPLVSCPVCSAEILPKVKVLGRSSNTPREFLLLSPLTLLKELSTLLRLDFGGELGTLLLREDSLANQKEAILFNKALERLDFNLSINFSLLFSYMGLSIDSFPFAAVRVEEEEEEFVPENFGEKANKDKVIGAIRKNNVEGAVVLFLSMRKVVGNRSQFFSRYVWSVIEEEFGNIKRDSLTEAEERPSKFHLKKRYLSIIKGLHEDLKKSVMTKDLFFGWEGKCIHKIGF